MEREPRPLEGWIDETPRHAEAIVRFLQSYRHSDNQDPAKTRVYNRQQSIHFSGQNSEVLRQIDAGTAPVHYVKMLYEKGAPVQLHVVFEHLDAGHMLDVYLTKTALADYLKTLSS